MVKGVGMEGDRPTADLDLVVASKAPSNVTQMIQEMESQGIFRAELVAQNPQRGKGETGSEYELNVHYVPRAGFAIEPSASNDLSILPAKEAKLDEPRAANARQHSWLRGGRCQFAFDQLKPPAGIERYRSA